VQVVLTTHSLELIDALFASMHGGLERQAFHPSTRWSFSSARRCVASTPTG
jgi:hypothetical protein